MILTTHQPIFLPWPGFFAKAMRADVMVLLDAVQFPVGRGWMNRNRLKSAHGDLWLTVPVHRKGRGKQTIGAMELFEASDWRRTHLRGIRQHYAHAPFLSDYWSRIEAIYRRGNRYLLEFNLALIRLMYESLGIGARLCLQSELGVVGTGTRLLVDLCETTGTDTYLALPQSVKYLESPRFRDAGVDLRFLAFEPPVYPQLWGEFRYNLSMLDLLLCHGSKSPDIIKTGLRP